ncbi:hypothetical protein ES703_24821 [subsurface metagenome]
MSNDEKNLGKLIKTERVMKGMTLLELSGASGVSLSHLGRIERGGRFPSALVLRKIAKPLGFEEVELITLAGYLSPQPSVGEGAIEDRVGRLDPYVAKVLSEEPVEVQRTVIGILSILKSITRARGF